MQAAAPIGPIEAERAVRAQGVRAPNEDLLLLGALPIAAAIVGRTRSGRLKLVERNSRFDEVMAAFGDPALALGDFRSCAHTALSGLMTAFLADFEAPDEYQFASGDGVGARHFIVKLAPLAPCLIYARAAW